MWKGYTVSLQLAAPLHIGLRMSGNVKVTRQFVLGRSIWGALACRVARDYLAGNYVKAGAFIHDNMRFTYLYPSDNEGEVTCWPWADPGEFAWKFLHSYTSTALVDGRSKLDGSLHETEMIAPRTRDGKCVSLLGIFWLRDGQDLLSDGEGLARSLRSLQIGAERSYGWGRVAGVRVLPCKEKTPFFDGWTWAETEREVCLTAPRSECALPSHVVISEKEVDQPDWLVEPLVEPLVGRYTDPEKGQSSVPFGARLSTMVPTWAPGSKIDGRESVQFQVGRFGLWSPVEAKGNDRLTDT